MDDELKEFLTNIVKKQDRILAQQTKIMKALHLLPVTEKEERALQIQQRENAGLALKVAQDLADMAGEKPEEPTGLEALLREPVYDGILGDDVGGAS